MFLVRWGQEPFTGASAEAEKWLKLESYVFIATATALDRSPARLQSGLVSKWLREPDCNAMASSMFVPSTTNAVNKNSPGG